MHIETCKVGDALRLGNNARIVIHRRQGERIVLGATAPVGTELIFDGAPIRPISGTVGIWSYLFSLHALRRFTLGRFEVCVWLPGEIVPLASDCEDWLHVGVIALPPADGRAMTPLASIDVASPVPAALALPPFRAAGGCRPFRRSA
jgi:hypothetical protein